MVMDRGTEVSYVVALSSPPWATYYRYVSEKVERCDNRTLP